MYPILVDFGALVLPAWHTFYVLGAIAALVMFLALAQRHAPEVSPRDLSRLYALCYAFSYFGARALSILVEEPEVQTAGQLASAMLRFGPMTFYGGALVAFAVGTIYALARGLPFAKLLDMGMLSGLVALAIGRIGCFLNGDDYGVPAPLSADGSAPWWAATFPNLADGVARYPVQLMETGLVLVLVLALSFAYRRLIDAFRPGFVGFLAIVGYANLRFGLEFLRDDFRGSPFGNWISTSQFISILILLAAAATIPYWVTRRRSLPNQAMNG